MCVALYRNVYRAQTLWEGMETKQEETAPEEVIVTTQVAFANAFRAFTDLPAISSQ